jgi:hypothetical protein
MTTLAGLRRICRRVEAQAERELDADTDAVLRLADGGIDQAYDEQERRRSALWERLGLTDVTSVEELQTHPAYGVLCEALCEGYPEHDDAHITYNAVRRYRGLPPRAISEEALARWLAAITERLRERAWLRDLGKLRR